MAEKKKKLDSDGWKITTDRYVAYIDIMGFKDLVLRSTHNEVYIMMKDIHESKHISETIPWNDEDASLVKSTTYSDSIMLYSKDASYKALDSLIATISFLINDLLIKGIPFKGALAYGKMTIDNKKSIYFGQPLIDAYLLQEELYFYGVIIHATAEKEIELKHKKLSLITYYHCPLKNCISEHWTVYPIFAIENPDINIDIKKEHQKLIRSTKKLRFKTSGHLRKYVDNTEEYLKATANLSKKS